MKMYLFGALIFLFGIEEVPYKPFSEFDFKLKYELKSRSVVDNNTTFVAENTQSERERRMATANLPYVGINVTALTLSDKEVRVRGFSGGNTVLFNKKIKEGDTFFIEMGFTDDIKDGISPNQFDVFFLDSDRNKTSLIVFKIERDGTFFVNNEKRGKF